MKFKKAFAVLVLALALMFLGATKSEASLYLNNLDFDVQINEDGSMDVTETWDISVSETNTLYKTFNKDSQKYSGLTNISVAEITNGMHKSFSKSNVWQYHLDKGYYFGGTNNDGKYEIAWGVSIDTTSSRKYQIKYTVEDVIHKYADCAELYWQFVGSDFEVSADRITGTIKLPNKAINNDEIIAFGHTEYLNGEIYVTSPDTIEFHVDNFRAGRFVEIRIAMPTYLMKNLENYSNINKLDSIIEEETVWANEANERREKRDKRNKVIAGILTIGAGIGAIFFATRIAKYKKVLRENPKIEPEQKLEYFRELPDETATPLEAVFMLRKGYSQMYLSDTFSATILDLTLKKHITIEQNDKKIIMHILDKPVDDLKEDEKKVLSILELASKDKVLTMKDLEKYIKNHPTKLTKMETDFEHISKETAEVKEKFSSTVQNKSGIYIAKLVGYIFLTTVIFSTGTFGIGMLAIFADNAVLYGMLLGLAIIVELIINIILVSKIIGRFNGFTQKGVNEQEQWRTFKKYMEDFSYLNEKEVPALVLWEKYLVYATAFGIASKVLKQLQVTYPELNNQDTISNMVLFNAMYNSNGFNTGFINSISSSTSRMYSSTYSSGSGGGGGFSGGGRRRRSVEVAGGGR